MCLASKFAFSGEALSCVIMVLWHRVQGVGLGIRRTWDQNSVLPFPSSAAVTKRLNPSGPQCPQRQNGADNNHDCTEL